MPKVEAELAKNAAWEGFWRIFKEVVGLRGPILCHYRMWFESLSYCIGGALISNRGIQNHTRIADRAPKNRRESSGVGSLLRSEFRSLIACHLGALVKPKKSQA